MVSKLSTTTIVPRIYFAYALPYDCFFLQYFFFLLAAALQNILAGVICHHSAAKKMSSREKRLFVHIKVSKAHTLQTNAIKQDKMVNRDAVLKGFLIGYLLHSFAEDRNLIFGHTRNCHM